MKTVISNKRTPTNDKKFIIRWIDENGKDRLKTIGNYTAGIREKYCKAKREEIVTKIRLGEELPHIAKPKQTMTIFDMSEVYFEHKASTAKDIENQTTTH
ncbi:MAG: hypothetical protein U9O83_06415 [Campylobacterota bacterium]|nr:hypothetical protein [Campylobacterota bacterium]